MRKIASSGLALAVVLGALTLMATPASARSKHHHHHHHHPASCAGPSAGLSAAENCSVGPPACGPGTVLVTALNQCVPFPFPPGFLVPTSGSGGSGFAGSGGITISPTSVFLTPLVPPVAGKGTFTSTFTMSGLPPLTTFTVGGGDGNCPMTGGGTFATTSTSTTITFSLANTTPGTPCQQGGHPVTATSSGGTPFTAFVNFTT
jgi:hypothetical protein